MKFEGQQVNIPIKGIMRAGTDNLCADGAMNEVIGMEYKDGSWLPYKTASSSDSVSWNGKTVTKTYVHKIGDSEQNTLYLTSERNLYFPNGDLQILSNDTLVVTEVRDVAFVGNMLCVATDRGLEYYICEDGVYSVVQTGYYPQVDLRVTSGLYEKEPYGEVDSDLIGMRNASHIMGERLDHGDSETTIINEKTRRSKVAGGLTAARGEVRDRGGLTGHIIACVAYRGRNGEIIAANAPVLLARPQSALEGKYLNLGMADGKFYKTVDGEQAELTKEELLSYPVYQVPSSRELSWDREESDLTQDGMERLYKDNFLRVGWEGKTFTAAAKEGQRKIEIAKYDEALPYTPVSSQKPLSPTLVCTEIETFMEAGATSVDPLMKIQRDYTFLSFAAANTLQFRVPEIDVQKRRELYSICIFISPEIDPFRDYEKYDDIMGAVVKSDKTKIYDYSEYAEYRHYDSWATSYYAKERELKNVIEDIKNINSLYLVKEINIEDITPSDDWVSVDLKGLLGDTLMTRESLPVTAFNRDKYYPNMLDTYNLRLHMYDYTTELYEGSSIYEFAHHGGEYQYESEVLKHVYGTTGNFTTVTYKWEIQVTINDGNGETTVVRYENDAIDSIARTLSPLISYPSRYADSIVIRIYAYSSSDVYNLVYEKKLSLKHDSGLGVSYYVDPDLKPILPEKLVIELSE